AGVVRDESVTYEARHGHGFSTFSARHGDVDLELTHIVDRQRPVRLSRLTVSNKGKTKRRLRNYAYAEWVLGNKRAKNAPFIVPSYHENLHALLARNPYHVERSEQVAFFAMSEK